MLLALYSIHTQGSQYSCGTIQLCCSRHERAVSARGGHRQDLQQDRWRPRLVERRGQRQGNKASKWSEIKLQILQYKQYKFTLFPCFFQIGWFPSTYVDEEGVQWNSGVKDHPIKSTALGEDSLSSFSLETHFTMNISTFVSFRHVRICFFSLSRNICVISVKKTAPSLFVLSGGRRKLNGAELALKWPKDKHGFKFGQKHL